VRKRELSFNSCAICNEKAKYQDMVCTNRQNDVLAVLIMHD